MISNNLERRNFQAIVSILNLLYTSLKLCGSREMALMEILQCPVEILKLAHKFIGQEALRE